MHRSWGKREVSLRDEMLAAIEYARTLKLSVHRLARQLGIPRTTLNEWINHAVIPSAKHAEKLINWYKTRRSVCQKAV